MNQNGSAPLDTTNSGPAKRSSGNTPQLPSFGFSSYRHSSAPVRYLGRHAAWDSGSQYLRQPRYRTSVMPSPVERPGRKRRLAINLAVSGFVLLSLASAAYVLHQEQQQQQQMERLG